MKLVKNYKFIIIISLIIAGCESNTEPILQKVPKPYMSLHIGDIRQYYDDPEGLYLQTKIVDTTHRVDGQKVFVFEESFLSSGVIFKGTNYYFIKNGFFLQTELDTVTNPTKNHENPFLESKPAKIFPKKGDYFMRTAGVQDSEKVFFKINIIDSLNTTYRTFNNVAEYKVINSSSASLRGAAYYAEGYGHIGSIFISNTDTAKIFIIYSKVDNKEIGKYVTFFDKTPSTNTKHKPLSLLNLIMN